MRDDAIRNAWLEIRSDPPWSVEKFINELSGYDDESLFELLEQSMYQCTFYTEFQMQYISILNFRQIHVNITCLYMYFLLY